MAEPIGVVLQQLADLGVFFYVIPFLLIFALVYAILFKINIMGGENVNNRGVYAIIAASVALLALQFDVVPTFFQVLFPKLGVGLAVILTSILLLGIFMPNANYLSGAGLIFFVIGAITGIIILISSFSDYAWWTGGFWQNNIGLIIAGVILLVFVGIVVSSGSKREPSDPPFLLQHWPMPGQGK